MKFNKRLLFFVLFAFVFFPLTAQGAGSAKIIVKVIDEEGQPIENALVRMAKGGATIKEAFKGTTDADGIFSNMIETPDGLVGGAVIKEGYYKSNYHHSFFIKKFGRWQPWEKQITVVMRPILNPVPMYVSDRWIVVPEVDKNIGFDLMQSDWVSPYGTGEVADFLIKINRKYVSVDEFQGVMELSFSNKSDGIIKILDDRGGIYGVGSIFRLPRFARKDGYNSKITKTISAGSYGWNNDSSKESNYIFRVRSQLDESGNIENALYGKILGDIIFDVRATKTADIKMHYYLNPDGTRNLEFDPERNLFRKP